MDTGKDEKEKGGQNGEKMKEGRKKKRKKAGEMLWGKGNGSGNVAPN